MVSVVGARTARLVTHLDVSRTDAAAGGGRARRPLVGCGHGTRRGQHRLGEAAEGTQAA